jgi:hypothetical protein
VEVEYVIGKASLSCCKEEVVEEHLILMATDFGIQQL